MDESQTDSTGNETSDAQTDALRGQGVVLCDRENTRRSFCDQQNQPVPTFLREAQKQVAEHGQLRMDIYDIESCYPNMPRETIRFALRDIFKQMETKHGYNGVWVPKWSDKRPCA